MSHLRNTDEFNEAEICKHFGCGKRLTNRERLFGNLCTEHAPGGNIIKSMSPAAGKKQLTIGSCSKHTFLAAGMAGDFKKNTH